MGLRKINGDVSAKEVNEASKKPGAKLRVQFIKRLTLPSKLTVATMQSGK